MAKETVRCTHEGSFLERIVQDLSPGNKFSLAVRVSAGHKHASGGHFGYKIAYEYSSPSLDITCLKDNIQFDDDEDKRSYPEIRTKELVNELTKLYQLRGSGAMIREDSRVKGVYEVG